MRYSIEIRGISPLICHNGEAGLNVRSPENLEKAQIARKRGSNRTEADDERLAELEALTSLYWDNSGEVTLPPQMLRSNIEKGARKLKQGPQVREGLIVEGIDEFIYDREQYGTTPAELGKSTQFTTGVVVQRSRILRTRAKFEDWGVRFTVEIDPELVDREQLATWLDISGRRIGLGDWRPEKSGHYGRFETVGIEALAE